MNLALRPRTINKPKPPLSRPPVLLALLFLCLLFLLGGCDGRSSTPSGERATLSSESSTPSNENATLSDEPGAPDGSETETSSADGAITVPAVPENVSEEEILVSGSPDYPLPGTLTLPDGVERPPVVIFVHGSGASDRNETINGNAPFRDIAWGLAEQGIASIRYDKRYYVYPQAAADPSAITIEAEALEDVDAAIALAMNDSRLDHDRVYVLGHSLGGMLAPAIAGAHPQLAGIISMAGSLRPLWEIIYDQNEEAAETARPSLNEEQNRLLDEQLAIVEADIDTLRHLSESGQLADPSLLPEPLAGDSVLLGIPLAYWCSLERQAGLRFIERVTMPLLILQGDADFQVYPDKDYPLWQDTLAGRDNAVFHLYNGLNHLMMPTRGRRDIFEYAAQNAVSPEVIADIADFILRPPSPLTENRREP